MAYHLTTAMLLAVSFSVWVFCSGSAHPYLPLRIGGFYSAEELSMSSDRDFPDISKARRHTVDAFVAIGRSMEANVDRPFRFIL